MDTGSTPFIESRAIDDIDAVAGAMAEGLLGEYMQLEAKRFTGRWITARLPQMVLQMGREDVAVARRLRAAAGVWSFIVPLAVAETARWDARTVDPDDLVVCAPGAECCAFDPGGTEFAIVSVAAGHPAAAAAHALLQRGETTAAVVQRGRDASALRDVLAGVLRAGHGCDHAPCRPDGQAVAALLPGLDRSLRRARPAVRARAASSRRRRVIARAEAFFQSHLGESVSIAKLSSVAGVSERSLRNAFYEFYGTGPKRYLRLWQLHQVRRGLRAARDGALRVTDFATLHGFFELGRFAGEYKTLFGESPSRTLQLARLGAVPICDAA